MRREWEPEELIACWTLVEGDAALIGEQVRWRPPDLLFQLTVAPVGGARDAGTLEIRAGHEVAVGGHGGRPGYPVVHAEAHFIGRKQAGDFR